MAKSKEPTHFVVGTCNSNGEEYTVFRNQADARGRVTTLIEDGFDQAEIVWIEGVSRKVQASVSITVEDIVLT